MSDPQDQPKRHHVFQVQPDVQVLKEKLKTILEGEQVSYSDLSEAIGRNVMPVRYLLSTARRQLLRDEGILFSAVSGFGLARLGDSEKVASLDSQRKRINRAAKRAVCILSSVRDFDGLPKEEQRRHNAGVALMGTLAHFSGYHSAKRIEKAVEDVTKKTSLTDVAKAAIEGLT